MSLIPRSSLFNLDDLFDGFWAPARLSPESPSAAFSPRVDVTDKNDRIEITAELPGVKKDDIRIHLENGVLTLSAESQQENKEEKNGKVIRQERRYGTYMRSFQLGSGIQESDITAQFTDGVLTLSAPKAKTAEPERKRIEIS
ncbi:Hsp20/alpha crystallin family protein [Aurantivibrio plasticivorans]